MKNRNEMRRAAIAALAAVALMAAAGQAGAGPYRFPVDVSRLPDTRASMVDDGSVGWLGRLRMKLASARILRDSGWEGIGAQRQPAKRVDRKD